VLLTVPGSGQSTTPCTHFDTSG